MNMSFYDRARRGLPIDDALIIDCHDHIGFMQNFHISSNTAEGMLESMDALGIDSVCVAAHASIGPDYRYGNDIVIDAISRYPGRFYGYVTVNPNYEDDMGNELDRCFAIPGFIGIKLHPDLHGSAIDNKNYRMAYETADERRCPILIHVWGKSEVAVVDRLAGQYPDARFIMGHAGGDVSGMTDAIDVVNRHNNVYADLAISFAFEGNVEWLVGEMGAGKILFGTDMPFIDPRSAVARVAMAEISDDDKRAVFGLNMKKLAGI
jgi:predicted TIM-barrel fold metal-dependent hydrolase